MPGVNSEADRHEARRNGGDWMDTSAAAGMLGCSRAHVRKLVRLGYVQVYDASIPGAKRSDYRFRRDWLDAYLKQRTHPARALDGAA